MFQSLPCKIPAYFSVRSVYCELFSWHPSLKHWSHELCQHQLTTVSSIKQDADKTKFQNLGVGVQQMVDFTMGTATSQVALLPNQSASPSQHTSARPHAKRTYFNLKFSFPDIWILNHSLPKPVPRAYPLMKNKILISHLIFSANAVLHAVSWTANTLKLF